MKSPNRKLINRPRRDKCTSSFCLGKTMCARQRPSDTPTRTHSSIAPSVAGSPRSISTMISGRMTMWYMPLPDPHHTNHPRAAPLMHRSSIDERGHEWRMKRTDDASWLQMGERASSTRPPVTMPVPPAVVMLAAVAGTPYRHAQASTVGAAIPPSKPAMSPAMTPPCPTMQLPANAPTNTLVSPSSDVCCAATVATTVGKPREHNTCIHIDAVD
mmetsp:Transcript_7958/g.22561  ORF Transcript_7958/g.22561 Transcript_7958/m.22561 type:complete len:215 (+) Transcript_7958:684-1328(+)